MHRTNNRKEGLVVIIMAAAVSLLTGCATAPTRAYKGPELPVSQVSKISCERKHYTIWTKPQYEDLVMIRTLDGKEIDTWWGGLPTEILVLPGKHEVVANMKGAGGGALVNALYEHYANKSVVPLNFNAEAGKSYTICAELLQKQNTSDRQGGWVFWLEEVPSGKVVCGRHPEAAEAAGSIKTSILAPKIQILHDYGNPLR